MKFLKWCFLAVFFLTSGCLTSEGPFYQRDDIKVDDRMVGTYQSDKEKTSFRIQKDQDHDHWYLVTTMSDVGSCSMRFNAVLFEVGTNRFLDMVPVLESCDHIAGTTPGPIEILQGLTLVRLHMVVKIDLSNEGLKYGFIDQQGLSQLAREYPQYFQPTVQELPRILSNPKLQRDFLLHFGGDTNVFRSVQLKRVAK